MRQLMQRAAGAAPAIARDLAALGGAGLIVAGLAMIYIPAAMGVAGGMLIAVAVLSAR